MNKPTLILDEGGMPILEQCEGVIMPADYSFKCINNYVHCESPQYEDLENLALGMSLHIEALKKENERLRGLAITAEKWRGIATAKFGDGRTVSEIEREACEALRKENEKLRDRITEIERISYSARCALHADVNDRDEVIANCSDKIRILESKLAALKGGAK